MVPEGRCCETGVWVEGWWDRLLFDASPARIPPCTPFNRRVFDILAPSLGLSPYTDTLGEDYPFSVK